MKRAVWLWAAGLILTLAAALVVSCRDDVYVPFPPSINGNYTGIYKFTEIHNTVDTQIDTSQLIEFMFRKPDYSMDMDGSIAESSRVFCDVLGTYVLGNGVAMTITDSNYTRGVCTQYWGPGGYFSLDQTTDTTRLLHDSTANVDGTTIRYIRLLRLVRK
ncbi:MAG: hypothetical protein AB1772_09655 [Candidatus Zixiibacteriota bacterium]